MIWSGMISRNKTIDEQLLDSIYKQILELSHILFQVLCGFEPIFDTTHPNEEPII